MELIIKNTMDGKAIDADWTGTLATGSVVLSDINTEAAAAGTAEKLAEVKNELENGTLKVFDTSKFAVDGAALESYMADVNSDADNTGDTEAIVNGYFHESEFRSAPYFDVKIDGIELLNSKF